MIRTTIAPTLIKGGFRGNVIPSEAEALIDIRTLRMRIYRNLKRNYAILSPTRMWRSSRCGAGSGTRFQHRNRDV